MCPNTGLTGTHTCSLSHTPTTYQYTAPSRYPLLAWCLQERCVERTISHEDESTLSQATTWRHLCMLRRNSSYVIRIFAKRWMEIYDWCKSDTRKTRTDASSSPSSFGLETTYFWTGPLYSARLQNVPPLIGITSYHHECRDFLR